MPGLQNETRPTVIHEHFRHVLGRIMPEFELAAKAELVAQINDLKRKKRAIVLGHNYMEPAIYHGVADFTGDSLELCRRAKETDADTIVFCGVEFMAETAKIINPGRTVLIPSLRAGCSLAASITAADVRALRDRYPGVPIVAYVNTYAAVKAEVDICCTSGNAARVVASLNTDTVIFLPDEYLARNIARDTGRTVIVPDLSTAPGSSPQSGDRLFIGWHGRCEVHEKFTVEDVRRVRQQFPGVAVLAHPECSPDVVAAADFAGSTAAMIEFVEQSPAPQYLLLTECAMGDNIIAANPDREVLRLCGVRCPHMHQISLEETLAALEFDRYVVDVPEPVRERAQRAIDRMLAI